MVKVYMPVYFLNQKIVDFSNVEGREESEE